MSRAHTFEPGGCVGDPICDFCEWFDFNPDKDGGYVDHGACTHPEHPGPTDPIDWCADFGCRLCKDQYP